MGEEVANGCNDSLLRIVVVAEEEDFGDPTR